jgi:hypothetical protein
VWRFAEFALIIHRVRDFRRDDVSFSQLLY